VAVAPVPLSNYAFDTNIDSGLGASFGNDADSVIQDLFLTPIWTALVWLIHVAVVALEWCYAIDLLAPRTFADVSRALGGAERVFTEPWLGLALTLAGVACAWNGLVRRRVAETAGEAILTVGMIAVALWIIADPGGTIGSVSGLADEAALGTVAAATSGNPTEPVASLDAALGEVFDSAITAPWCYLEFGDVDWCRNPARLDPALAATARELELLYNAGATCGRRAPGLVVCAPGGSPEQRLYASTALALASAKTNGALFLALPADGLARNQLASQTSLPTLYGTLCGNSDPTDCTAGTAPQAEFRTASGTWPRAGGLLLIAIGVTGMLAALGFVALRLLGAALGVLVYLLLAPVAAIAPAFGQPGRATFRRWLTRLIGAALAKLVYSVLLGVLLLVAGLLATISTFGWWTQWLLISAFWWLAFEHRHTVLAAVIHERAEPSSRMPLASRVRYGARAVGATADGARLLGHLATRAAGGASGVWTETRRVSTVRPVASPGLARRRAAARANLSQQLDRSFATDRIERSEAARDAAASKADLAALRARRLRLVDEQAHARESGDSRRAGSLSRRIEIVDAAISGRERAYDVGRTMGGRAAKRERRERARLFDREAMDNRRAASTARDYGALLGLVGITRADYARRSPSGMIEARVAVERELARRRQWLLETRRQRLGPGFTKSRAYSEVAKKPGLRERQFSSRLHG
jgi:hypothetical protein